MNGSSPGAGSAVVSIATACGCTVRSAVGAWMRASSSRLPPQRTRVTSAPPSDGAAATQFAARGRSSSAATWARTSLPRSVPGPRTAVADSRRATSTIASAIARGACEREDLVLRHVERLDPVSRERRRRRLCRIDTSADRLHRAAAEGTGEGQRLQRRLVDGAVPVLDVDQGRRHRIPISCSISTTRGAADAPSPRISACLPSPSGTTSRSFSSRASGRAGERVSTGFRCARRRPGTDG